MPNRVEILIQDEPRSGPIATEFEKRKSLLNHLAGYGNGIASAVSTTLESSASSVEAEAQTA